jgi:hypothetical protein
METTFAGHSIYRNAVWSLHDSVSQPPSFTPSSQISSQQFSCMVQSSPVWAFGWFSACNTFQNSLFLPVASLLTSHQLYYLWVWGFWRALDLLVWLKMMILPMSSYQWCSVCFSEITVEETIKRRRETDFFWTSGSSFTWSQTQPRFLTYIILKILTGCVGSYL